MVGRRYPPSSKAIAGTLAFYADAKAGRDADRALEEAPGPDAFRFVVPGDPVAKARARVQFKDRDGNILDKPHSHTPDASKNYADLVKFYAARAMRSANREPFTVPISIAVAFFMPIPTSFWKAKAQRAACGEIRPSVKPDLSNLLKQIEDASNGIVFKDDALIVESHEFKYYDNGKGPRVLVSVAPIGPDNFIWKE